MKENNNSSSSFKVAIWSLMVAAGSLLIAAVSLFMSGWQFIENNSEFHADYDASVTVSTGKFPINKIKNGDNSFNFKVINSSKRNINYFAKVESNMGCVTGSDAQPKLIPCGYESQNIALGKKSTKNNSFQHEIKLKASPGAVNTSPLAYSSPPKYFLNVEIFSARNRKPLFQSLCYYSYDTEYKAFVLYQPIIDTSGYSVVLQSHCRG